VGSGVQSGQDQGSEDQVGRSGSEDRVLKIELSETFVRYDYLRG
jgi:hypothetical protein